MRKEIVVAGIDPGFRATGIVTGLVTGSDPPFLVMSEACIRTAPSPKKRHVYLA